VIRLQNVSKKYRKGGFFAKSDFWALKGISVEINPGEHVGIIGESGAGKTTLGRILSLIELPTDGLVEIENTTATKKNLRKLRKYIAAVFQDPGTSLDPLFRVVNTLKETGASMQRIMEVTANLNIRPELLQKYPSQLSGGEQQRIAIARAILSDPTYIILDEATSALDVSTQAKIMNLLCDLNASKRYAYVFISHDLSLANFISDRIYVMHGGSIVEEYDVQEKPLHPYTISLLKGTGKPIRKKHSGCFFYEQCPSRTEKCKKETPQLIELGKHKKVRCFLYD